MPWLVEMLDNISIIPFSQGIINNNYFNISSLIRTLFNWAILMRWPDWFHGIKLNLEGNWDANVLCNQDKNLSLGL